MAKGISHDTAELEETKRSFQLNTSRQLECRSEVWSGETGHYLIVALMGASKITENDPETGKWREGTMSKVWQVKKEIENHK